ncbi:hypothetical protein [Mesorhizobium sp. CA14]|nr:hypothetical protein [Mesorhizobium sp. CA14]
MKLLIIGGYGTFGGRIDQLLENEPQRPCRATHRHTSNTAAG